MAGSRRNRQGLRSRWRGCWGHKSQRTPITTAQHRIATHACMNATHATPTCPARRPTPGEPSEHRGVPSAGGNKPPTVGTQVRRHRWRVHPPAPCRRRTHAMWQEDHGRVHAHGIGCARPVSGVLSRLRRRRCRCAHGATVVVRAVVLYIPSWSQLPPRSLSVYAYIQCSYMCTSTRRSTSR